MQYGLMADICEYIADTHNDFQLTHNVTQQFREYIFDKDGEYLKHGGKQVASFIIKQIKLMQEYAGEVKL